MSVVGGGRIQLSLSRVLHTCVGAGLERGLLKGDRALSVCSQGRRCILAVPLSRSLCDCRLSSDLRAISHVLHERTMIGLNYFGIDRLVSYDNAL